jgi:hypothetical protein
MPVHHRGPCFPSVPHGEILDLGETLLLAASVAPAANANFSKFVNATLGTSALALIRHFIACHRGAIYLSFFGHAINNIEKGRA